MRRVRAHLKRRLFILRHRADDFSAIHFQRALFSEAHDAHLRVLPEAQMISPPQFQHHRRAFLRSHLRADQQRRPRAPQRLPRRLGFAPKRDRPVVPHDLAHIRIDALVEQRRRVQRYHRHRQRRDPRRGHPEITALQNLRAHRHHRAEKSQRPTHAQHQPTRQIPRCRQPINLRPRHPRQNQSQPQRREHHDRQRVKIARVVRRHHFLEHEAGQPEKNHERRRVMRVGNRVVKHPVKIFSGRLPNRVGGN